jgi:hypothetical protein
MGVAAGYTWRDRISQARRARERERRERRRRQAEAISLIDHVRSAEPTSSRFH